VAGVSKVSALKRTTDVVEHREGGDPSTVRKSPGQTKFEAVTLERGVTHDPDFEQWAGKVWNFAPAWDRRSRWPISARISSSRSTTRPGR
jgi:phage tail-like protein